MSRPLTWLYRKLGRWYPNVFITLELQTAFVVGTGAVALFAFYYDVSSADFLKVLGITLGMTAVAIVFVLARVYKRMRPLNDWIGGQRSPQQTNEAWHLAVNMPLTLIRRDFFFPIVVTLIAVVSSIVILDLSWLAFFPIMIAGVLAIAYSGTLHYLALELAMRPILFDINSALDTPVRIDRPVVPLRFKLLGSLPLINVITGVVVVALTSSGQGTDALGFNVLIALAVSFLISFELTVLLSRSIMRPIEDLEAATERIRQGRFDEHVPVTTSDEFGELSSGFNQMVDGLAERERLREAFGTYLDEEVARHIIDEDYDPEGQEIEVSLVFCDVRDFTTHAAEMDASGIVARLNEMFECIVPIVSANRGHIDQFIGDAVLAVFGAPHRIHNHADRAVQCAVEIARTVNSRRPGGFEVGVGVNSGKVVAGSIGGAGRLSFSVIGDAVNLAARVEAATRDTGDSVLITGETRNQLSETIEVESRGEREIRGYDRKVELYAPVVPIAVTTGPGADVNDPLGDPVVGGLGPAVAARARRRPRRCRRPRWRRPRPAAHAAGLLAVDGRLDPPVGVPADRLNELFQAPEPEFVPKRNELAKSLSKDGHPEAGDWVKSLKKPSKAAWLVNQLAARKPQEVAELLEAGEELRRAQEEMLAGAPDRDKLREAAASEQRLIDSLLRTAEAIGGEHKVGSQILTRVGETLQAASGDTEVAEAIERGHLLKEQRSIGLAGGAAVTSPAKGKDPGKTEADERRSRADTAKRRKTAERELASAEKRLEKERDALERAREKVDEHERRVHAAELDANAARRALDEI